MIGIYKITSPSNKIYIGETINIVNRWNKYKRIDCKGQPKLYNSLKKYGYNNHKFEIVELCSFEKLKEKERYYQELYDCIDNGLNCFYTETKDKKRIMPKEVKQKMSDNRYKRPILQFSLDGKFIKEWNSATEASKFLKINRTGIYKTCSNLRKKSGNFIWIYKDNYSIGSENRNLKSNKIKKVAKLSIKGNILKTYPSVISTEKDGFKHRSVSAVCTKRYKTHFGFKWKYIN